MKNFLLIILVVILAVGGFFVYKNFNVKQDGVQTQTVLDINKGMELFKETPKAILLDVRTKEEYENGYIEDSINVPLDEIDNVTFEKDSTLFVYCKSGKRAGIAVEKLEAMGYKAYNIGGFDDYTGITVR